MIPLAILSPDGRTTWHGVYIDSSGARALEPTPPASLFSEAPGLDPGTRALLDLLQAASSSYIEDLEIVGRKLDDAQAKPEAPSLTELTALHRAIAQIHPKVARLSVLVTELGGPLGTRFPGLADHLPVIRSDAAHLEEFVNGLSQGLRDLVGLRNAVEANRLAEAANEIGRVSNRIAALANTSNLRMLGIAYLALFIALLSGVILFPNTGATILGMPSAAWVPGIWVDVILLLLALVPLLFLVTRPWVRHMFSGLASFEGRSAEGLADLPEVPAQDVDQPSRAEKLIRQSR
ncbi:MAG TPA: hypothetical protein VK423_00985 [Thermoplasmata archaeon]|nr:hypothetical protein [Thermoplasmata archaeon]